MVEGTDIVLITRRVISRPRRVCIDHRWLRPQYAVGSGLSAGYMSDITIKPFSPIGTVGSELLYFLCLLKALTFLEDSGVAPAAGNITPEDLGTLPSNQALLGTIDSRCVTRTLTRAFRAVGPVAQVTTRASMSYHVGTMTTLTPSWRLKTRAVDSCRHTHNGTTSQLKLMHCSS